MLELTPAQERVLRMIFESDPQKTFWSDCDGHDGLGRNPTRRILRQYGLIEYRCRAGNSWVACLTVKGIHYLHGEIAQ